MDSLNPKGIRLMLVWDKLTSVNRLYVRTRSGMTMSPEARDFKKEVTKQVRHQLPKNLPFGRYDVIKLSLHFLLKERFFNRDTSNFIKLVEDTIFDELGVNDARNIELDCRKSILKNSKHEYIKVTIEKSNFDYDYFNRDENDTKLETTELEDRTYSKEEMEEIYSRGIMDAIRWGLEQSPIKEEKPKRIRK